MNTIRGDNTADPAPLGKVSSDIPFMFGMVFISCLYMLLIIGMLLADATFTSAEQLLESLNQPNIRFSIYLSLITCTITAILSVIVAVPIGYLLSRYHFPFKNLCDAILDIPIVLPPLVIGLSLLILFNHVQIPGINKSIEECFRWTFAWVSKINPDIEPGVTYKVPAVILAQFMVACAFAVRTMRTTFDQISTRHEDVALTLGCNRSQAFWNVVLPESWRGVIAAGTLAWARSLGEFGPILVFAGANPFRTEVLPTTVFLEISIGNIEGAVAVSLLMVFAAMVVLLIVRTLGLGSDMARIEGVVK